MKVCITNKEQTTVIESGEFISISNASGKTIVSANINGKAVNNLKFKSYDSVPNVVCTRN